MSRTSPFSRDSDTLLGVATALDTAYRFRRVARVARPATVARMAAVADTAGTLRTRRSRRHQRRAAYHARRAVIRSYRIGPTRAATDRRVRTQLVRAGDQARKAVSPPDHTTRNRLLVGGAIVSVAGSLAAYLLRGGGDAETAVPVDEAQPEAI